MNPKFSNSEVSSINLFLNEDFELIKTLPLGEFLIQFEEFHIVYSRSVEVSRSIIRSNLSSFYDPQGFFSNFVSAVEKFTNSQFRGRINKKEFVKSHPFAVLKEYCHFPKGILIMTFLRHPRLNNSEKINEVPKIDDITQYFKIMELNKETISEELNIYIESLKMLKDRISNFVGNTQEFKRRSYQSNDSIELLNSQIGIIDQKNLKLFNLFSELQKSENLGEGIVARIEKELFDMDRLRSIIDSVEILKKSKVAA